MSSHWFYSPSLSTSTITLIGPEAHHLAAVKRVSTGTPVTLFDGKGNIAHCQVDQLGKREVILKVNNFETIASESRGKIIIATSLAKGDRFDWLIAICTQLGVDRIIPVLYERTVKKASAKNITDRFDKLAISAAKQCKRPYLPIIDTPCLLSAAIEIIETTYPNAKKQIGSLQPECQALATLNWPNTAVVAFIGPEGGMTQTEEALLTTHGAAPVRLTDHILRIEAAAQAFSAILAAQRHAHQV